MRLRFPRQPADLFRILALCDPDTPLDRLLADIDFGAATLPAIYHLVHRRLPEFAALADGAGTPLAQHLESALLSDEFQERALSHLMAAFPELPRSYLLQEPAMPPGWGGAAFAPAGYLPLDGSLTAPAVTGKPELLATLAHIVRLVPHIAGFFLPVDGDLAGVLRTHQPRPSDRLITVIDDPVALLVRQANRAIATLLQDPQGSGTAARDILRQLGLARLPAAAPALLHELAIRALLDPLICPPDPLCRRLGAGPTAHYAAAISSIVSHDIEMVDLTTLSAWAARHAKAAPPEQIAGDAVPAGSLTVTSALAAAGDRLLAAVEQDRILREVVLWGLARHEAPSVRGSDLVDYAGHRLLDGLPRQLMRRHGPKLPDPVVVTGHQPSLDYLAHRPAGEPGLAVRFGIGGNADAILAHGWSGQEAGYVWSNGFRATLYLPRPAVPADQLLRLHADPYVAAERRPFQDVDIVVNGEPVAAARLTDHAVMELRLPWALLAEQPTVTVDFDLPFATRPADIACGHDIRQLALCLREAALMPLPAAAPAVAPIVPPDDELITRFESLGENCEFGLVQRRCGAEPLGLLRFTSAPLPKLLDALTHRFAELGRADLIEVQVSNNGQEYMVLDRRYGFLSHAWVLTREKTVAEVHQRECRRLPFLARKLVEDLTEGEKLFVFHGMTPLTRSEAQALAAAVGRYGAGSVLWVELADADHAAGSVEWVGPGLLKGHVDRFAPGENAHDLSLACWLQLCRNAYVAWQDHRRQAALGRMSDAPAA